MAGSSHDYSVPYDQEEADAFLVASLDEIHAAVAAAADCVVEH